MLVEHYIWTRLQDGYGYLYRPTNPQLRIRSDVRGKLEAQIIGSLLPRNAQIFRATALHCPTPNIVLLVLAFCGKRLIDDATGRMDVRFIHVAMISRDDARGIPSAEFSRLPQDIMASYVGLLPEQREHSENEALVDALNLLIKSAQMGAKDVLDKLETSLTAIQVALDELPKLSRKGDTLYRKKSGASIRLSLKVSEEYDEPHRTMLKVGHLLLQSLAVEDIMPTIASYRITPEMMFDGEVWNADIAFVTNDIETSVNGPLFVPGDTQAILDAIGVSHRSETPSQENQTVDIKAVQKMLAEACAPTTPELSAALPPSEPSAEPIPDGVHRSDVVKDDDGSASAIAKSAEYPPTDSPSPMGAPNIQQSAVRDTPPKTPQIIDHLQTKPSVAPHRSTKYTSIIRKFWPGFVLVTIIMILYMSPSADRPTAMNQGVPTSRNVSGYSPPPLRLQGNKGSSSASVSSGSSSGINSASATSDDSANATGSSTAMQGSQSTLPPTSGKTKPVDKGKAVPPASTGTAKPDGTAPPQNSAGTLSESQVAPGNSAGDKVPGAQPSATSPGAEGDPKTAPSNSSTGTDPKAPPTPSNSSTGADPKAPAPGSAGTKSRPPVPPTSSGKRPNSKAPPVTSGSAKRSDATAPRVSNGNLVKSSARSK